MCEALQKIRKPYSKKKSTAEFKTDINNYRHQAQVKELKQVIGDLYLENQISTHQEVRWIHDNHRKLGSIARMIGIAKSTYYHKPRRKEMQLSTDLELRDAIENIHLELPGYGYRRIREHLLRKGKRVNCKRIRRVMKEHSLLSCVQRLMRPRGALTRIKLSHPNLIKGKIKMALIKSGQLL